MQLETSVFTANRGYAWTHAIAGASLDDMNTLYRYISDARGDFPDPMTVEVGLVSNGRIAAIFTIQNVDKWDSEERACDYAAFAFFDVSQAKDIDFVALLQNDFFWTPSRTPPTSMEYTGPTAASIPVALPIKLRRDHRAVIDNPKSIGTLISRYGAKSDRWVCRLYDQNVMELTCNEWNSK